ncbi:MAG: ABC transporter ATP-binding protein/permease [Myxacorys californica WJT36-NPBG1]|jgi:ATP-binding cassette subfamily B protein|nr:ABC transporter ATP-binding protein/permease [Myxacorys californica WJT36-NPBG1]
MSASRLVRKFQQSLRFLPALRLVWKAAPSWTVARILLLIIQGILPLIGLYLTKLLIDAVTQSLAIADKSGVFQQTMVLLALLGASIVATTVCASLSDLVNHAQSEKVTNYMQSIVHAKSIEVDLEYYENAEYHNSLQRAQQEACYRPNQILNNLVQVSQEGISLVTMIGVLVSLHWGIAGILFVAALPAILVKLKYARVIFGWHRRRTEMERQTEYLGWMLTDPSFAKEIRLFDLGKLFSQRFDAIRQQLYREGLTIETRQGLSSLAAQLLAATLIFAAYSFIVYQTLQGSLKLGDLVIYHEALQRGQSSLRGLLGSVSALYEDNLFLTNLYEFLELEPGIKAPAYPKLIPCPMRSGIVFDRVSFQYGTTTRWAIKDVSLSVRPGEVIALVGENGSGKTTLIKLLCRLYAPTTGRITLDGVDLSEYDIIDLRRQISVIFQDYVKYYFSASENIWLGNIEVPPTHDNIVAAARHSGADEVIRSLPHGYDTILGKLFDQGEELSIGQWQKVALARAFLRKSQLIVLDEPTSAMDPKAEYEVFQNFRRLIKDQAAILISHRLSTVKMADRIYVVDRGNIIESGTHAELVQLRGAYAQLFETQAKSYQ